MKLPRWAGIIPAVALCIAVVILISSLAYVWTSKKTWTYTVGMLGEVQTDVVHNRTVVETVYQNGTLVSTAYSNRTWNETTIAVMGEQNRTMTGYTYDIEFNDLLTDAWEFFACLAMLSYIIPFAIEDIKSENKKKVQKEQERPPRVPT